MRKEKSPAERIAEYEAHIDNERKKWDYYKVHGGTDGWPDGVALNLTRNHIIYDLMMIASIKSDGKPIQVSMFDNPLSMDHQWAAVDQEAVMKDKRIPPEVSWNLMVTDRVPIY